MLLYLRIKNWWESLLSSEEGQGLVEYALIIVLIAIVVIVALGLLGEQVENVFEFITTELSAR